jgi:hypothetical protein
MGKETVMTDTALPGTLAPADSSQLVILRAKIGWICHAIRIATAVWLAWILVRIIMNWYDRPTLERNFSRFLEVDLSDLSQARYILALALLLLVWACAAALGLFIWRLFGSYLEGRIFTVDAALRMRRAAIAGFVATFADIGVRPLYYWTLIGHLPDKLSWNAYIQPNDLLHLLLASFIFALATIFKTAAEIADDHSQIV